MVSGSELETLVMVSALIFVAVVFGVAVVCAFIPARDVLDFVLNSAPFRLIFRLGAAVASLAKSSESFGGKRGRKTKVAPVLTDDEATVARKKLARKRKTLIEEVSVAAYCQMSWCVDRAMDADGNPIYEQGLRLYLEPEAELGEEPDEDAPFVDVGEVIGAEAVEEFPGVVRLRRKFKGNIAVELSAFDPSLLERGGVAMEPLWKDVNEAEWDFCRELGVFNKEMFGRPEALRPDRPAVKQGFHPDLLEIVQLLTTAAVIAINGTVDEDAKMNCSSAFWCVDRLVNVAGRPVVHKGVHVYLEDLGDPDDPDDDEMRHAGRVVAAAEVPGRSGIIRFITSDPAGEMAVQGSRFRGTAIDPRGLTREPLWATMAPRWIDHGNKGGQRRGGKAGGTGIPPLPRVTAAELATALTRTLAVDRQLEAGAVDAEEWRKARGTDPAVRDIEAAVEETLDRLLYIRGNPEGYEAAQERARDAEEAAANPAVTELRIVIREKLVDAAGNALAAAEPRGGSSSAGGRGSVEGGGGRGSVEGGRRSVGFEEAPSSARAAEGRGAVTVDHEGLARGEVRIDVDMGDRDTVYLHLDAEALSRLHSKRD